MRNHLFLVLLCATQFLSAQTPSGLYLGENGVLKISEGETLTVNGAVDADFEGTLILEGTLDVDGRFGGSQNGFFGNILLPLRGPSDFGRLNASGAVEFADAYLTVVVLDNYPTETTVYSWATSDTGVTSDFDGTVYPDGGPWSSDFGGERHAIVYTVNTLPVEWLTFTGHPVGKHSQLNWATAGEENASHFEVERRSPDGRWTGIGRVAATNRPDRRSDYDFLDEDPGPEAVVYYRLRQVDLDGDFTYSEIVRVSFDHQTTDVSVYPNPTAGQLRISNLSGNEETVGYRLSDATGRRVLEGRLSVGGGNRIDLPPALASGTYFLRVGSAEAAIPVVLKR